MKTVDIHVRSTALSAKQIYDWLKSEPQIHSVKEPAISHINSDVLDRTPQRQTELLDIVISFVVNITTAAAFEAFLRRFKNTTKERGGVITKLDYNAIASPPQKESLKASLKGKRRIKKATNRKSNLE